MQKQLTTLTLNVKNLIIIQNKNLIRIITCKLKQKLGEDLNEVYNQDNVATVHKKDFISARKRNSNSMTC